MSRFAVASAFALTLFACGPAAAQSDEWQVSCTKDSCTIVRALTEENTDRLVATFLTVINTNGEAPGVGVAVPLGLAIEPGILIVADETEVALPFQVCFPDGCRAIRAATDDEISLLSSVDEAQIRFFPFGESRPVAVTFPMSGYEGALARAREAIGNN